MWSRTLRKPRSEIGNNWQSSSHYFNVVLFRDRILFFSLAEWTSINSARKSGAKGGRRRRAEASNEIINEMWRHLENTESHVNQQGRRRHKMEPVWNMALVEWLLKFLFTGTRVADWTGFVDSYIMYNQSHRLGPYTPKYGMFNIRISYLSQ